MENQETKNKKISQAMQADQVEITYYTDPLCCWSWAFEQHWKRLLTEYKGKINYRYCMGGLIPAWDNFNDTINFVSRPIQMGPVWMHASQVAGVPIYHRIWMEDPPASSYPACIAFKAAEIQSPQIAEVYLALLREAVMIKGKNISKKEILLEIAKELHEISGFVFDFDKFEEDLVNDLALEAFRKDLQEVNNHNLNRFPTLILRNGKQQPLMFTGYRPYEVLWEAFNKIAPGMEKSI